MTLRAQLGQADGDEIMAWHRLDVCCWPALARTRATVIGVLNTEALAAVDGAIEAAVARAHSLTLDLTQVSTVTPDALNELLTRGYRSRGPAP